MIAMPRGVTGGRFIYEHSDGRREYVEAMLSSTHTVSESPDRPRGDTRGYVSSAANQYTSGDKR